VILRASELKVKVFADGADLAGIQKLAADPLIKGFTTNPTLMRKAGISDYESFAKDVLGIIGDRPISFEVFADDGEAMTKQALKLASWGPNVYVKIPVTTTNGDPTVELARHLAGEGVQLNVTAMMTVQQVEDVLPSLAGGPASYVSLFAGRVADTGVDPIPMMKQVLSIISAEPQVELIWASPREVLNIVQADEIGCDVITVTHDLLSKLSGLGKDLTQFSLETVVMFYEDASASGFQL
jgi:transaldolase